jgi:EAL domain-containing protein (putative c-di-GMP-specific phosphodiesterase class I)
MELIRGVDGSAARQVIIAGLVGMARQLDVTVLAEGVETEAELMTLRAAGITLFQGFYFAKPQLETFQAADALDHALAA